MIKYIKQLFIRYIIGCTHKTYKITRIVQRCDRGEREVYRVKICKRCGKYNKELISIDGVML